MTQEAAIDANVTGASKKATNTSPKSKPVPFCKLFTYATTWDKNFDFYWCDLRFPGGTCTARYYVCIR